jgi:PTS system galactitol-specific IIB component
MVRMKLENLFSENQIDATINCGSAPEADTITRGADLIITTTKMPKDYGIPVIDGISLIHGIGEEDTYNEIIEALK